MSTRTFIATLLLCALSVSSACRGDDGDDDTGTADGTTTGDGDGDTSSGGDGDTTGGDGDGDAGDQTIYAVQKGDIAVGSRVTLRGVVITAIDAFGNNTGTITVQELEVDPASGTYAYGGVNMFGIQNAGDFDVGDVVDVVGGEVQEFNFNCLDDPTLPECSDTLQTVTQVSFGTVQQVGTAELPEPVVLDPRDLGDLSDDNAMEAEKWEGVIVRFEDVAAVTPLSQVGSSDPRLQEFRITGALRVVSNYTSFENIENDQCFESVTGLLSWFFDYQLLPRSASDFGKTGTNCPAPEATADLCNDQIDNDADGFTDCEDFSCTGIGACVGDAVTIAEAKALDDGTPVRLDGVVVVGVQFDDGKGVDSIWVQDAGSVADDSGIKIYRGSQPGALPQSVAVGAVLSVQGEIDIFSRDGSEETQIRVQPAVTDVTPVGSGESPVYRTGVSLSALANRESGEAYEGQAIEISGVVVGSEPTDGRFTVTDGVGTLTVSDFFGVDVPTPENGQTITTLRGVMGDFAGTRQLYPLVSTDVVAE